MAKWLLMRLVKLYCSVITEINKNIKNKKECIRTENIVENSKYINTAYEGSKLQENN